jgi:NMD protein affecting ribosome stability and mRNA decay
MYVTIYYYSDQIIGGEMLLACSRHKICRQNFNRKTWMYWSESSRDRNGDLSKDNIKTRLTLAMRPFVIPVSEDVQFYFRVMTSNNVLSAVTAEAAAHVRWGAHAVPVTRLTVVTQSCRHLLLTHAQCSFSAFPVLCVFHARGDSQEGNSAYN